MREHMTNTTEGKSARLKQSPNSEYLKCWNAICRLWKAMLKCVELSLRYWKGLEVCVSMQR